VEQLPPRQTASHCYQICFNEKVFVALTLTSREIDSLCDSRARTRYAHRSRAPRCADGSTRTAHHRRQRGHQIDPAARAGGRCHAVHRRSCKLAFHLIAAARDTPSVRWPSRATHVSRPRDDCIEWHPREVDVAGPCSQYVAHVGSGFVATRAYCTSRCAASFPMRPRRREAGRMHPR